MDTFLSGAVALGSAVVGLFFLRFWRHTGDRFFLYFAWSFWIQSLNRVILEIIQESSESNPATFVIRLVSYALILWAIWEKNRPSGRTNAKTQRPPDP